MGKLKLQMQISVDGMVGTQKGPARFNWDDEIRQYSIANTKNVDFILIGRKSAKDFIPHWKSVADDPKHTDFAIGKAITDVPKIVFSKTLQNSEWANATVQKDLVETVNQLKRQGKNLLVYGGHGFVASLIQHNLIDEYNLLVNPVLLGDGSAISIGLPKITQLTLVTNRVFSCGTILLQYKPS